MPREEPIRKRLGPKRGTPTRRRHVTPQQVGCKRTEPHRRLVLYMVARRCSAATNIYFFRRWLYRGQRPTGIARTLNRAWASIFSSGIAPDYLATLEVTGQKSGRAISFPVVVHVLDGQRYLLSILGNHSQKVQNACRRWESGSSERRPRGRSTRRSSRRPARAHLEGLSTATTGSATARARQSKMRLLQSSTKSQRNFGSSVLPPSGRCCRRSPVVTGLGLKYSRRSILAPLDCLQDR